VRKDIGGAGLVVPFNTFVGDEKSLPKLRTAFPPGDNRAAVVASHQ